MLKSLPRACSLLPFRLGGAAVLGRGRGRGGYVDYDADVALPDG